MGMILTEEQQLLRDSARDFIEAKSPVNALRALRDSGDPKGYSPDLWKEMVDLGWAGVVIPEEFGGLGFGMQGLGLILEETGKTLTASPLVSTVLTCGSALILGGNEAQKSEFLPKIAAGEVLMSLALEEKAHHAPSAIATTAVKSGEGYSISGKKTFVLDGHIADYMIVVARTNGNTDDDSGITLFIVPANAEGITITRTTMVDSRNAASVEFNNVQVGTDAVLGSVDSGLELLDQVLDRARIGLAAEMLGSAQQVFDVTLAYLKERKQFGVVIGQFQALQHRAAKMFTELELCRSIVLEALTAVDQNANNVRLLASLAKGKVSEAFHLIAREGVQMHGGIGMTDEYDIGLYLKRSAVAEQTFGGPRFHSDRYAAIEGY